MLANFFENYGQICVKHPWEVIVGVVTLTVCILAADNSLFFSTPPYSSNPFRTEEINAVDVIFMTIIRCTAVLYSYYQFRKLRKLGSNYILGIAGLFTVFSSFVFSSTVINFLRTDVSDLKDALFFFVLVIDLSKASVLAQFALNSSNQNEVNRNIARGMSLLGPTVTLDTLVGTLVISVGTLSGVRRLETLCCFACFSFVVNYLVFMTFYPACLSLVLELSRSGSYGGFYEKGTGFELGSPLVELLNDEGHKPNPVVQRVKVIMSAGMMIVHAHSRWSLTNTRMENNDTIFPIISGMKTHTANGLNDTVSTDLLSYLMKFLVMSTDHIVILILILALTLKYVFFDDKEELTEQALQNHQFDDESKKSILPLDDKCIQTECETTTRKSTTRTLQIIREGVETQTESENVVGDDENRCSQMVLARPFEEIERIYREQGKKADSLSDGEVRVLCDRRVILARDLEKAFDDPTRGVAIRRTVMAQQGDFENALKRLPYRHYDYKDVIGKCCENVLGYVPVPIGVAGPLDVDGVKYYVPMATTEGCLVASTNRGCKILNESGGVRSRVVYDGMTRGPVVQFPSIDRASIAMQWINDPINYDQIANSFNSTSNYARLQRIRTQIAGRKLYLRFTATTGDAMGMNMVSKGTEEALRFIQTYFEDMDIISVSGNTCTDKKSAAINWIEGRGKGVVCEAVIPKDIIEGGLKTTAQAMFELNISKNLMGSAMAGSVGGFNAHAANIVTAVYIATGQDPAQNVCSSYCMTLMEPWGNDKRDLYMSCTMPSLELGTHGGGTALPAQSACLDMLRVKGTNSVNPGDNAKTLARVICAAVLAGELSLLASLAKGDLVTSHLKLNRNSLSDKRLEPTAMDNKPGSCISC